MQHQSAADDSCKVHHANSYNNVVHYFISRYYISKSAQEVVPTNTAFDRHSLQKTKLRPDNSLTPHAIKLIFIGV